MRPHEIDEQGRRWTFPAWAKDLALHLDYLGDLTLVSPVIRTKGPSANSVSLDEPPFDRLKFVDLPYPTSRWEALKTLPRHILQCWRAIGPARVVHCGFAGWPLMQAWVVVPLAKVAGGNSSWPTSNHRRGGRAAPASPGTSDCGVPWVKC